MRGRVAAACALVAIAAGAGATGAAAAKAPLWLVEFPASNVRAPAGRALEVWTFVEGTCGIFQKGTLATNGNPRDEVGGIESPFHTGECRPGEKAAGAISSLTMTPDGSGALTMSVKDTLHVFFEPWCVYTLPKKMSFAGLSETEGAATFSSALDKSASFGSCAAKRTIEVGEAVLNTASSEALFPELTE